ncbi:hypothetical protein PGH07_06535 [Sulfurovum sp. zt1-1]|uniref:Cytochrome c domain-containing protein n=1 Tax=Sulfurovum zhangzhouensis TaxID=3019067 RepID=A0ABT7QYH0_9BACT|nr:hypothetical protein [Sulfurovum zhangzhouensis]MDM5271828.1 hypothetical protein [Sulfurovum zhangzhouensis]
MVKKMILFILLSVGIFAENAYERNCIPCHTNLSTSLQGMFKNYLLVYSGEETVKAALRHYMRYPSNHISVMSDLFLDTYGIKEKLYISDEELKEAIDIYWETYKVFGKLN